MNEKISALMDCELDAKAMQSVVDELLASDAQQSAWHDWHCARNTLQGGYALSPDFMAKFSARLAAEPIMIAPQRFRRNHFVRPFVVPLTVAASVMLVGLTVWQLALPSAAPQAVTLAQVSPVKSPKVLKSTEISPYLAAHRGGVANPLISEQFAQVAFEAGEQH